MADINIRRLIKRPKGSLVRLPPIQESIGATREYQVFLRKFLRTLAVEVRLSVIPAYSAYKRQRSLIQDDLTWFGRLYAKQEELSGIASDFVRRIIGLESKRHTETFIRSAKRAFGIDLKSVIHQEDLVDFIEDAAARNISLIRSLSADTSKRIEQTVLAAKVNNQSVGELRKDLQKEFGIQKKRAELIAQDQMSKLTSDLNRKRQQQVGISEYTWTTSRDERVRARHAALDGKIYKWGEPTGAEQGLSPGQPIRCRCVAVGVVRF